MAKKKTAPKKSVRHNNDHHDTILLSAAAIILLIFFGGFFAVKENPQIIPSQILNLVQLNHGENVNPNVKPSSAELMLDNFTKNLNTKRGNLMDVSGGSSNGTAYTLRTSEGLKHMIIANLPNPKAGEVYEGWLVQQEPELMYFSTGEMQKQYDGQYALMFEDDELHEGYDFVVITLESKVDATPEAHILEGTVK